MRSILTVEILIECQKKEMSCKDVSEYLDVELSLVYAFSERNGITLRREKRGGKNYKDMTGMKFGSLIVLRREFVAGQKLACWECQCKCGNKKIFKGSELRAGKIKTCGCRINVINRRNWQGYKNIPQSYWRSLSKNSTQRNIKFNLTIEYINCLWEEQNSVCKLSGLKISFSEKTASLDRINNNVGYVLGNVQWVHKDINKLKSVFSQDKFIELCNYVSEHNMGL